MSESNPTNRWTGSRRELKLRRESWGFAIGAALFALGASPLYASAVGARLDNTTYFIGSLFFTTAGFIQLRLSGRPVPHAESHRIEKYDWWSALIQFVGTLLFNVSTGAALIIGLTVEESDQWIWRPDVLGSIGFLAASALAVIATTETDKLWDPHARNWRSTWWNMLGSVAFGVSAVAAFVVPSGKLEDATVANMGTLIGAICFLVAALLMRAPRKKTA
ncbi:hypothetical protein [Antrihabitans sp. YC2-6]|uniref:hypothetical protein n=1 Tax=Antrihabitans sp. YC2-6 TaxID=2799498 RepID=UPI0018F51574|nr:hypothetical protein [Antrihabitans sp. YC2-6]MBJ8348837.1 hypothetical protein [Antrihabitans sp. YC2-6]